MPKSLSRTTIVQITLFSLTALFILFCLGKCVYDARAYVSETRLTVSNSMSPQEQAYRNCLRREAGMVGVVSLTQMKKCTKETGYAE